MSEFIKLSKKGLEILINQDEISCIIKNEEKQRVFVALRHDTELDCVHKCIVVDIASYEKIKKSLAMPEN